MTTPIRMETTTCGCIPLTCDTTYFKKPRKRPLNSTEEEFLAEGLSALSTDERAQALQDVHGVGAKKHNEEPTFVESRMIALKEEIGKISGKTRRAYDLAIRKNSQYVNNNDFYLMFLRADEFNVEKAAIRIMKHFEVKLEIFGEEKLVKDIDFDDLSEDDQASASTGSHQILSKDENQRTVLFAFPELFKAASFDNLVRAQWYHYMVALEEESTQRNGFVVIAVGIHSSICSIDYFVSSLQSKLIPALPSRLVAFHWCIINERIPDFVRLSLDILGNRVKGRFRLHVEECAVSCLYTLQSFGIDPANVPIEHDGKPNTTLFLEYLETRKSLERQRHTKAFTPAVIPSPAPSQTDVSTNTKTNTLNPSTNTRPSNRDILLGRGHKHPGNVLLDDLVDNDLAAFRNAPTKFSKTCIVLLIIKRIEERGARFFHFDKSKNEWNIADDAIVRRAVSVRFRNKIQKMRTTKEYR